VSCHEEPSVRAGPERVKRAPDRVPDRRDHADLWKSCG
jgi:hypothetical protein